MKFYPLSISALWKNLLFLFLYHRSTLFSFQGTILLKRIFDFCLSALHHVSRTFCCRSVHSAFCAPHAALRACVSHAPCTVAIFCFAKNAGLAWIFVPFQTRCIHSAAAVCTPLFCAPHAALRARVSHAPCTVAIFCFAKNAGLAWIFVPFQTRCIHSAAAVCTPLFCAPHAALRVRVSHAPCTVAIFCFAKNCFGGDEENRTPDPLLARQVLSQLSYTPKFNLILRQNRLAVPTYCLRRFFLG